jgi:hypothetical protein
MREPTGTIAAEPARIKLQPLGTPLRALARAHSDGRLVLEAELPWLQLGAGCSAELSDGRCIEGSVQWIGLDMTRSGTARLRILVNTQGKSIMLSVHDADVEELQPKRAARRLRRAALPLLTTVLAATAGWLASRVLEVKPQLLAASEAPVAAQRSLAPPPVVKIPAEQIQLPSGDVAVVVPMAAPAVPQLAVPQLALPAPETKPKKLKPANHAAASRPRHSSRP